VLLESATLPGSDVDELMEQARQEVEQARELIDDVLFLGELETGREVVSLGRTRGKPVVEEVVAQLASARITRRSRSRPGSTTASSCRCGRGCCVSCSRTC
jgi:signal transduction histidine kinase